MDTLLEIIKFTLPSLVVFLTVWILMRTWSRNEDKRRKLEFNKHLSDEILPVQMQAYERIILLLERISPDSLILRISRPDFSALQLQKELLMAIKQEFDHNLAQQMYVSSEAWDKVKHAKNQIIGLINSCMQELKPDAKGTILGKLLIERIAELQTPPSQTAIDFLKKEVRELFL
ncbi:MAG: hypothetical protein R2751_01435 [Bacteroidales bacterium]